MYLISSQAMKSKIELGRVTFYKVRNKKGSRKKKKTSIKRSRSFAWWEEWKVYLVEFWPSNAFATLKTTFGKHQLIIIGITCVSIKTEVKKMMQLQGLQLQMKLVLGNYMKTAIWWGKEMTLLIGKDVKLLGKKP